MSGIAEQIEGLGKQVPRLVLLAIVVAVLLPAANYSMSLQDPTPPQLLIAICIGVFSSTLCLWLMDSVSVLQFRSEWVSRSVWGAAVVSILGTGVGVFQGALAERQFPFEGQWEARVFSTTDNAYVAERRAVLTYSRSAGSYWGYSGAAIPAPSDKTGAISIEVVELRPEKSRLTYRILFPDGRQSVLKEDVSIGPNGKRISSADMKRPVTIVLSRPR